MRIYDHPFDALDQWDLKPDSEIERIVSKDTIVILREAMELLAESDDELHHDVGLHNFVVIVREMRRRKKSGSQTLGRAILDASDWLDQGRVDRAREVYEAFLATCKIRFFRKIAESELERL